VKDRHQKLEKNEQLNTEIRRERGDKKEIKRRERLSPRII
jgi:hypothetical protein